MIAAIPAYGFMGCTGTILGLSFNRIRVSDGSVKDKDITSRDFVPFQKRCLGIRAGNQFYSGFGGLEVACWPLVPKYADSNPTEAVGFFRAKKNPQHAFLRRFTACKRSLNVTWKSGIFRQNSSVISRPCSSTLGCQDLSKTTSGKSWNIRK